MPAMGRPHRRALTGEPRFLDLLSRPLLTYSLFDVPDQQQGERLRQDRRRVYTELTTDHPMDLCRYQVANCVMGRAGLINSGGASGANDFAEAVKTAVINKRAERMGLVSGRKAFQRPMAEGVKLRNLIQDVYPCKEITVA
jgi:class I fructose-bisphosphate aldolase